jgi:hypothetical protein
MNMAKKRYGVAFIEITGLKSNDQNDIIITGVDLVGKEVRFDESRFTSSGLEIGDAMLVLYEHPDKKAESKIPEVVHRQSFGAGIRTLTMTGRDTRDNALKEILKALENVEYEYKEE